MQHDASQGRLVPVPNSPASKGMATPHLVAEMQNSGQEDRARSTIKYDQNIMTSRNGECGDEVLESRM